MRLSRKLFLALLIAALVAIGIQSLILRLNLGAGFNAYLRAEDEQHLDALAPALEAFYREQGNWNRLRLPSAHWTPEKGHVVLRADGSDSEDHRGYILAADDELPPAAPQGLMPPSPAPDDQSPWKSATGWQQAAPPRPSQEARHRASELPPQPSTVSPPSSRHADGETGTPPTVNRSLASPPPIESDTHRASPEAMPPNPSSRTEAPSQIRPSWLPPLPELAWLGDRLNIYDDEGHPLLGRAALNQNILLKALRQGSVLIGWIGVSRLPDLNEKSLSAFLSVEKQGVVWSILLTLFINSLLAWWLSRHLLQGVGILVNGNRELRRGNLSVQIPVISNDELGRLAEDFNALAQSLSRTEHARQQWAADIAHELRTPLTVMRAELESMQDGIYPLDTQRVDMLHADVLQLSHLVEDLNTLSMAEMGSLHYRMETLRPDELIATAADSMRARMAEKGLEMHLSLNAPALHLKGDAQKLTQVINNLLENACRYTDAPGQIRISSRSSAKGYEILIEDSPPGVPDWALPRLFDRLFRLDQSRSRAKGGSGLGLAICQTIVTAHDGRLSAEHSTLGGLCMRMNLPLKTALPLEAKAHE